MFCPHCHQKCRLVDNKWVCPIHGILPDEEESEEEKPSYIR